MKSWKTSAGGIAMILSALSHILNGYNATKTVTLDAEATGLIMGGIGLIFARDHNVTSEQSGLIPTAVPPTPPAAVTNPVPETKG